MGEECEIGFRGRETCQDACVRGMKFVKVVLLLDFTSKHNVRFQYRSGLQIRCRDFRLELQKLENTRSRVLGGTIGSGYTTESGALDKLIDTSEIFVNFHEARKSLKYFPIMLSFEF